MIKLNDSEWVIMKILWKKAACSLSDISITAKDYEIYWTRSTAHTILVRLIKKEAVIVDKTVYPYVYSAILKREECCMAETKEIINRVFDGSLLELLSTMLYSKVLTSREQFLLNDIVRKYNGKLSAKAFFKNKRHDEYIMRLFLSNVTNGFIA